MHPIKRAAYIAGFLLCFALIIIAVLLGICCSLLLLNAFINAQIWKVLQYIIAGCFLIGCIGCAWAGLIEISKEHNLFS